MRSTLTPVAVGADSEDGAAVLALARVQENRAVVRMRQGDHLGVGGRQRRLVDDRARRADQQHPGKAAEAGLRDGCSHREVVGRRGHQEAAVAQQRRGIGTAHRHAYVHTVATDRQAPVAGHDHRGQIGRGVEQPAGWSLSCRDRLQAVIQSLYAAAGQAVCGAGPQRARSQVPADSQIGAPGDELGSDAAHRHMLGGHAEIPPHTLLRGLVCNAKLTA
ncbi:hypothetical protein ACFQO7_04940 [Catellatospora aurea]|uniref:Uncharacterized protein n=1 Tax=Catellatospora aurea TaxID=1337874 RepID=A0ABW2GSK9_9ACTN